MKTPIIQKMLPADWARVRTLRLNALEDAPDAFGTTLAEDRARPLGDWRVRLEDESHVTFVARMEDADVGLATGSFYEGLARTAGLFGMWVAPSARGCGVGGALVDAVIAWARSQGYERILLDVGDDNPAAIRLYESRGFQPNGATGSLPAPREHVLEHQRELRL